MRISKKVIAAVTAAIILFVLFFSLFFIAGNSGHRCTDAHCPICCEIKSVQTILNLLGGFSITLAVAPLLRSYRFAHEKVFVSNIVSDSLITLKVKLSD